MTKHQYVTVTATGCFCPHCGNVPGAERKQQDPAPCGCAWVWEPLEDRTVLMAVPSMADVEL